MGTLSRAAGRSLPGVQDWVQGKEFGERIIGNIFQENGRKHGRVTENRCEVKRASFFKNKEIICS